MGELDVSAVIHTSDPSFVLVNVHDESGDGVKGLKPNNFDVRGWATIFNPGSGLIPIPIANATDLFLINAPDHGFFYELELGPISFDKGGPPLPLANLQPTVYTVMVKTKTDRGEAIACACCEGSSDRGDRLR